MQRLPPTCLSLSAFAFRLLSCLMLCLWAGKTKAQKPDTHFNGFGHLDFGYQPTDNSNASFGLGEHDFFITSKLNKNISFLGEYVFRFNRNSATAFLPSIERSLVKINYIGNHSVIAGKIHTPVNYWNDVYHHGRLFFPTIDRPSAFSYLIPLHTLGVQMQGQNQGKLNWGYDIFAGNGISSNDAGKRGMNFAWGASLHFKPTDHTRIGASFYSDFLPNNKVGAHSGHDSMPTHYTGPFYRKAVDFRLACLSIAHFANRFELLSESAFNTTRTDSLGLAQNYSSFLYAGYVIGEKHTPYMLVDYLYVDKKDLYTYPVEFLKAGIGYKYEFNHLIHLKSQLEYQFELHDHKDRGAHNNLFFKLQLAYGF